MLTRREALLAALAVQMSRNISRLDWWKVMNEYSPQELMLFGCVHWEGKE